MNRLLGYNSALKRFAKSQEEIGTMVSTLFLASNPNEYKAAWATFDLQDTGITRERFCEKLCEIGSPIQGDEVTTVATVIF